MDMPPITLPPPIDGTPTLSPVRPPAGSPNDPAAQSQAFAAALEKAASEPVPIRREVAELVFVDGASRERPVKLRFPFEWEGVRYDAVHVRRLNTDEVGRIAESMPTKGRPDPIEIYAVMTGLPASVLRALDADDGIEVSEVAAGFFPPMLKTVYGFE